jgi:hypothetical protein
MVAAAAATGILSLSSAPVFADSQAQAATEDSGGVLSGNTVQAPVNLPLNLCGNTVTVIGSGNSSSGNVCSNEGGATADSVTAGKSGGLLSGNVVQAPVNVPLNLCGNNVTVIGSGNDASDNACVNLTEASNTLQHPAQPGDSSGTGSGNVVQAPVNVPLNLCGNNVTAVGSGNDASGNACLNETGGSGIGEPPSGPGDSPGTGSGNHVDIPVNVPVNGCGNPVVVGGSQNPASDNTCTNESQPPAPQPPAPQPPAPEPPAPQPPAPQPPAPQPPAPEPPAPQPPAPKPPTTPDDECPDDLPVNEPTGPGEPTPTTPECPPPVPCSPETDPPECEETTPPTTPPTTPARPPAVPVTTPPKHLPPAPQAVPPGEMAHTGAAELAGLTAASASLLVGGAILYRRGRAASRV